jgi:dihydrofolate reductase
MTAKLRVHTLSLSLDGYVAGPDQSLADPLGVGGEQLHEWAFATPTFQGVHGADVAGPSGIDDAMAAKGEVGIGATIMGRNMFGPVRGEWPDEQWKGWWGTNPPWHHHVFVLTHHARSPIEMDGGTTFHFVTDGIEAAREQAITAAGGLDVRIGGGADTVRQYMRAGLVDHLHLAIVPVLLGSGERLFDDLPGIIEAFDVRVTPSDAVVHVEMTRR